MTSRSESVGFSWDRTDLRAIFGSLFQGLHWRVPRQPQSESGLGFVTASSRDAERVGKRVQREGHLNSSVGLTSVKYASSQRDIGLFLTLGPFELS